MRWSGWIFAMPGGDQSGPTSKFSLRLLRLSLRGMVHAKNGALASLPGTVKQESAIDL